MTTLNPGSKVFKLVIRRNDTGESWGFRLQGGKDLPQPVSVAMVNPGGVADAAGMKSGDAVLQINGINTHELEHEQAKYEILKCGNEVEFTLQRGAVTVWRPQVTKLSDLRGEGGAVPPGYDDTFVQKTSLAANKPEAVRIGSAHNRSARPFPGFGGGQPSQPAAPAAPQPPQQQYEPPQQYGQQPQQFAQPPQQYGQQPQQYGQPPQQQYGQQPQQFNQPPPPPPPQQFNQPPQQQYSQPPQQYSQPPQQYSQPPQQYSQPPQQYGQPPQQYGQPSPYGQPPSSRGGAAFPPNAQPTYPGGPEVDDGSGGKGLVHAQYNSPMAMYSNENIMNTFQAHANVLAQDLSTVTVSADEEVSQINSQEENKDVSNLVTQDIKQEMHRSTIEIPSQRSTINVPNQSTIQVSSNRPTIQIPSGQSTIQVSSQRSTIQVPSRSTIKVPGTRPPKPQLAPKPQIERRPSPILLAAIQDDESTKGKKDSDDEFTFKGLSNPHKQSRTFKLLEAGLSGGDDATVAGSGGGMQGFKSVSAPAAKPPGERQQPQQPQQLMTCKACGSLCTGVFIRIKGAPLHAECFKCVKCGVQLKNIGYFEVEGKFYCETHAKQVAQPPAEGMVAVPTFQ